MPPIRLVTALLACLPFGAVRAAELPELRGTDLFSTVARGCAAVDLPGWHHPARAVLTRPGVTLVKVELCNSRRFPVFFVELQYDPMGNTDDFFGPLYADLSDANGRWPFALVSLKDNEVVEVTPAKGSGAITVGYETFRD